jgi:hypothetical protein
VPSCATQNSARSGLPADTSFNKDAGHDHLLYLKLRLENGKDLLFAMDTGVPHVVLDKSLEPVLGKRLGTTQARSIWSGNMPADEYEAPKLYLGGARLLTGDRVFAADLGPLRQGLPLMGILGMDCLQNYCIQLDFDACKIRFLDPAHLDAEHLGQKSSIELVHGTVSSHTRLLGQTETNYLIDTGCVFDASLQAELFAQAVRELGGQPGALGSQGTNAAGEIVHDVYLPIALVHGEACANVEVSDCPDVNLLGLRFLARHLTTFDFPHRAMYLQRRNGEPFEGEPMRVSPSYTFSQEAYQFLTALKDRGQLPGWLSTDEGAPPSQPPSRIFPKFVPFP